MCGRFVSRESSGSIAEYFGADPVLSDELVGWQPLYNLAPTQMVRVVARSTDQAHPEIVVMRWGLVPRWQRPEVRGIPPKTARSLINARAETAADKPSFREAYLQRRCIVAMTGFYEWTDGDNDGTRTTSGRRQRQPHLITPRTRPMLAVGGIWNPARDGVPATVAILTTAANGDMAQIHDRMPVLLEPEDWEQWMDSTLNDLGIIGSLVGPIRDGQLTHHRVSTDVNSVRAEGPRLLSRVPDPSTFPGPSGSHDFGATQTPQLFSDEFGS